MRSYAALFLTMLISVSSAGAVRSWKPKFENRFSLMPIFYFDDVGQDTSQRSSIVKEEFVFTKTPFASCHASTLTETSPGHLLCAYFAGTFEGETDVAIWLSSFDEKRWSEPRKVADVEKNPCWNPVLFTMPSGEVLLFYKGGPNPQTWSGFLKRSITQGKEWSDPELLPAGILGPVRSKPLLLKNGTLLCDSSTETWRRWGC